MGYSSKIGWTQATVNFWTGCQKVSPGCKFCYMYRDQERWNRDPTEVIRTLDNTFYAAKRWADPRLIFTCSWSDFFIEQADAWRDDAWAVIRDTPHHTWQILTKRPERIEECLPSDWGEGYPNVWLGVSIETQEQLPRLEELLTLPAQVHFASFEPLLGPIQLPAIARHLHWMIIGGESGNDQGRYRYRPMMLDWLARLMSQAQDMDVPIFVKQLGTYQAKDMRLKDRSGADPSEWMSTFRIREFPRNYTPLTKRLFN